ncbi:MAG: hypothetical protein IKQ36_02715, partial [Clostridia bacterium]|nr:hypothetical protein [Clostridia bacterium]
QAIGFFLTAPALSGFDPPLLNMDQRKTQAVCLCFPLVEHRGFFPASAQPLRRSPEKAKQLAFSLRRPPFRGSIPYCSTWTKEKHRRFACAFLWWSIGDSNP